VFVQFTADEGEDAPIPDSPFGFAELIRAQAAGDYEVLDRRERRVIRVHLGNRPDEQLEKIAELTAAKV
jgi:glucose-6-phosphate isomerase